VDIADEMGNRAFNPPSLRGVGHGVAFFHEGRAGNLKEILTRYRHQVPADMPGNEVADLLAFLQSL
jgi:cytochrome c peroxidase